MSSTKPEGESNIGLERLVFFSDAVFAIAVTLLILDVRLPPNVDAAHFADHLNLIIPRIASYALSFFVIGAYWSAHQRLYHYIVRYDSRMIWLNLILLLFVVFIPFPTSLVADAGDTLSVIILYSLTITITGLAMYANWWYASSGRRLVSADLDEVEMRNFSIRTLSVPLIFLLSIGAALLISPTLAQILWGVAAVVALLPALGLMPGERSPKAMESIGGIDARKADADKAEQ